ncbi:MAG: hypothetical protein LQ344_003000 [Seirophora lacunosa]|nr:MAG: hypothetical protein LQ344_003000 [Seirophora lacunosa]
MSHDQGSAFYGDHPLVHQEDQCTGTPTLLSACTSKLDLQFSRTTTLSSFRPSKRVLSLSSLSHIPHIDIGLLQEIQFAADKHPIKITCAALGRGSVHGRWPERSENKELRGKVKEEVFEVIGLRLGGMQFMRWIWGEDDRQTFNNTGVYASAYLEPAEEAKAEESKAEEPK